MLATKKVFGGKKKKKKTEKEKQREREGVERDARRGGEKKERGKGGTN